MTLHISNLYTSWIFLLTILVDKIILIVKNMSSGTIFDIKRYAINDGPGIRTAVFFKGCPLECWWCHNPEGQHSQPQLIFRSNRCQASKACIEACPLGAIRWDGKSITDWEKCDHCGKCAEVCYAGAREIIGREITVDQLMHEIIRDTPFYDQSGGGVTFTGGEPVFQTEFLFDALKACKRLAFHTAVDTSGHASWEAFERIHPLVDLYLFDLKLMEESRHRRYTSVSNQLILQNLSRLSIEGAHIQVRIPLIPGINDDRENICQSAEFLSSLPCLDAVQLMPYHEIGLAKFKSLGMDYKLINTRPAAREEIEAIESILIDYHLPVIKLNPGRTQ
jgi:pyruvate formate lyase activating enzyme